MRASKIKIGDEFITNQGDKVYVIEYTNPSNVIAEFREPAVYQFPTTAKQLRAGSIKNRYKRVVSGVGFIGYGEYSWTKNPRAHKLFTAMMERCYLGHVNYEDCTIVSEWHNFQNFAKWCYGQKQFQEQGWHIDKDILVKGNRVYGPDTCCFVPNQINSLFVLKRGFRGKYAIGVSKDKWGKFKASCSKGMNSGHWRAPRRETEEEAFIDYKIYKEGVIKRVAEIWKDKIDPRVYTALNNWTIEVTD